MTEPPWALLTPAALDTCEPDLAGWVVHPAETASSLAYLVVAVVVWRSGWADDAGRPVRFVPAALAVIGAASIGFHATMGAALQRLDLAAIPLLTGLLLAAVPIHAGRQPPGSWPARYAVLAGLGAIAPWVHLTLGFAAVAAQAGGLLWGWRRLAHHDRRLRHDLRLAAGLLLPGAVLLALDHGSLACVGGVAAHLVQPHVAWHLLSAAAAGIVARAEGRLERRWAGS